RGATHADQSGRREGAGRFPALAPLSLGSHATAGRARVGGRGYPGYTATPHAPPSRPTVMTMNNRREVRDFLVSRRAKITPQQAGLTAFGSNRRVPGLRREEVAMIAGVSVDYYTRLEKGNLVDVSDTVLDAVARALQLDDVERAHMFDLSHIAN